MTRAETMMATQSYHAELNFYLSVSRDSRGPTNAKTSQISGQVAAQLFQHYIVTKPFTVSVPGIYGQTGSTAQSAAPPYSLMAQVKGSRQWPSSRSRASPFNLCQEIVRRFCRLTVRLIVHFTETSEIKDTV